MELTVLYVEGCPNRQLAESRARLATEKLNAAVEIRSVLVSSVEEAERLGFGGSPTILIDGADPFDAQSPGGLTCRLYPTDEGLEGAPSQSDLEKLISGKSPASD